MTLLASKQDVEDFLGPKTVSVAALAAGAGASGLAGEHAAFDSLCADKERFETLLEACEIPLDAQFSSAQTGLSQHATEEFCGGQRVADCRLPASETHFKIPLWKKEQEKTCFLPDILKLARQTDCRLIVMLDGDREWAEDGCNSSRRYLTLNDTTVDSSMESECSDKDGSCVLTWLRVYQPGERVRLDTSALDSDSGEAGLHDGKVFNSMSHEETAYGGFRCAMLRVDAAAWGAGQAPQRRVWSAFEALFNRGFSECTAAYCCPRVLLVDVCAPSVDEAGYYWGYGDRAAALIALDACMSSLDPNNLPASSFSSMPASVSSSSSSSDSDSDSGTAASPKEEQEMRVVENENEGGESMLGGVHPPLPPSLVEEERSLQELRRQAENTLRNTEKRSCLGVVSDVDTYTTDNRDINHVDAKRKDGSSSREVERVQPTDSDQNEEEEKKKDDDSSQEAKQMTELLLKCAESSHHLQQEYLSQQKQLANLKLTQRLQQRREEKEKKKKKTPSSLPPTPPSSSTASSAIVGSSITTLTDCSSSVNNINIARMFWQLLIQSRHLKVTSEQYCFVHQVAVQRAKKNLELLSAAVGGGQGLAKDNNC